MMRNTGKHLLAWLMTMMLCVTACQENVDTSARYVFKDNTVVSYLKKHEQYSEFSKLLEQVPVSKLSSSTLSQLLSARGHYTVFAPTNEAIHEYLETLTQEGLISAPSWDAFPSEEKLDSIRKVIVYNSVVDCADEPAYFTSDFTGQVAELPLVNLNDRKITYRYGLSPDSLFLNFDCLVDMKNRDIQVINGIIHCVHKVIWMKDLSLTQLLANISDRGEEGFLVASRLALACGLRDTMSKFRDEVYEDKYQSGEVHDFDATTINWVFHGASRHQTAYAPQHRKYGFTYFAETDDFWRDALGKAPADITVEDVQQWILDNHQYSSEDSFTTGDDYTSEDNLLHQWLTYHILPFKLPANRLVYHNNEKGFNLSTPAHITIAVMEFYATMGKRRLLKLFESKESEGVFVNRFPVLDNGRKGTYHELSCEANKRGAKVDNYSENILTYDVLNGVIYGIDAPIAYTDEVRANLASERIRFDAMTLFPEGMSNDIRKKMSLDYRHQFVHIPQSSVYQYFENLEMNDDCYFVYLNSYGYDWCNLQADELKAEGRFDITIKLPPVPRSGIYELRYRILANNDRGVVQFYFGDNKNNLVPTGIPVDLTVQGNNPITGWADDIRDDMDYNAEVDKRMRNFGAMKGEEAIANSYGTARSASNSNILRRILLRQFISADKTYYLRMKSVLDSDRKEFYMDHLEWCAKEVFDNPNEPEDIW